MVKPVHVLIVGSGISGLAMANLLVHGNKKVKFKITLFESRSHLGSSEQSIGGGIGIWPPAQAVLKNIPDYQKFIEQFSYDMPSASYRDPQGRVLARASDTFAERFPVKCMDRYELIKMLSAALEAPKEIEMVTSQKISHYERDKEQIVIKSEGGKLYRGDLLIACDGIHSKIRNCLMAELGLPPVLETELGYTYFRANTLIPEGSKYPWWSVAFETWGHSMSQQYGSHSLRFGYVPLKPPAVFWFIAIKTHKNHKYLAPIDGVQIVDEETKEFLIDLVRSWKPVLTHSGDVAVHYEELIRLTNKILRTDIAKIEGVEHFPWTARDNRIVLLGDSAHATAPNIAQGAGLCIEDAAYLASKLNRIDYLHGIAEYEEGRKSRAQTVQRTADLVAKVGQVKNPVLRRVRNGLMHTASFVIPSLQRQIFEYVVSLSLGGSRRLLYWQVPPLSIAGDAASSLFARIATNFQALDKHIKDFKTSDRGGSGLGVVTVKKPSFFARLFGFFAGFPAEMREQLFYAEVINLSQDVQCWKRVFGYKTPQQKSYATTHSSFCGFKRQMYLSEGIGGFWDKAIRFVYTLKIQADKSLVYESQGLSFFDLFKIPLPAFLLPKSVWIEKPTTEGWTFDGKISFPVMGTLLHYYGDFRLDRNEGVKNNRLIIAGGSGMIGKEVCVEFIKKGYDVYCLSRSLKTKINVEGVKIRDINEDWSDLIDRNTIILNLSGANAGAKRWSSSVKADIAESRYKTIATITQNIEKAREKPLKYLQASAAGFYGDAGDAVLTEESTPILNNEPGTKFRVDVCAEIEQRANNANCNVVNLRIGHVFSNAGGLLPYLRLSGLFNIDRMGVGDQFVPFVHIKDVVKAIEFIARNNTIMDGAVNISSPQPCRNFEMMKELRWTQWGLPLPAPLLKWLIGQSFVVLTDSERIKPQRLLEQGFKFDYITLQEVMQGLH
ncbi:DUF1731 domain-containing protein [Fluoribacter dumoffii]|uniref:DUF1731 domain-containing protein n=1 Tax=Fluoribacter dumoffii TaxID=463 RepID=UPI002244F2E8|nr:DUF1731 domain-containing protein [Fluoribacter dumoffii]MCW8416704.1 DUF1731 domain-containing protein [Fluoribacter dumoffii]MCW8455456.1 DUF1731 domain-containing protein [Fluoribacter dumoffii]MCW8460466.1 DUF1731 domain-containing protein [Fluoribacter dumoffii]MCW8483946.1 DUF1731 domain-containing protein [Fluoribacter dumoffii]